jgi:pyruvate dehydrogenase E1 component
MPPGAEEGIVKGIYPLCSRLPEGSNVSVELFGSGAILRCVLEAQNLLAEQFGVGSTVWSVTSYGQLRRDALRCERWNMLHPTETPQQSYIERVLAGRSGPFIAASDYVRSVPEQIARWIPGDYFVLGTDGFGRSDNRERLRRFFEVDAACITIAALYRLSRQGKIPVQKVQQAIQQLDVSPEKLDPMVS